MATRDLSHNSGLNLSGNRHNAEPSRFTSDSNTQDEIVPLIDSFDKSL